MSLPSKYHFELWSPDGLLLADLAGRAKNRRIIQSRNEAEDIYWQLDLNEFERYCDEIHADPNELLVPGRTEVRIRRGGKYICGGQLVYKYPLITPVSQDIELRAFGFLNLFKHRYTDDLRVFTATQATTIASTLINESQAKTNGDYGVTIGSLATVGTHDKTFKAVQIKEALKRIAEQHNFDFEFTHDKVFNTYAALGSKRPEIIFEYPGNIRELGAVVDGIDLANHVTVLGSGSGLEGNVKVVVEDEGAQLIYKLRESRLNVSEVEEIAALTAHGNNELDRWAHPVDVPDIKVDGNVRPYVTDYGIGDYVMAKTGQYASIAHVNGLYRVEKRSIAIDENDNETVQLYWSK